MFFQNSFPRNSKKPDFYHVITLLKSHFPSSSPYSFVEIINAMQVKIDKQVDFTFPDEIVSAHYGKELPWGFPENISFNGSSLKINPEKGPTLYTANLPKVLDWLHAQEIALPLENQPCNVPVLLFDKDLSMEKLLFNYNGTPESANLIRRFITLFGDNIRDSKAVIISPCFIAKSKQREEQEIVQLVSSATAETSFIKFNFNRIGDFWSYAVKHQCTLLVTSKKDQADLAKVLFHFYKGGMWYDRLSFYLAY